MQTHIDTHTQDESVTSTLVFPLSLSTNTHKESSEIECKAVRLRVDQRLVATAETCSGANYGCFHPNGGTTVIRDEDSSRCSRGLNVAATNLLSLDAACSPKHWSCSPSTGGERAAKTNAVYIYLFIVCIGLIVAKVQRSDSAAHMQAGRQSSP